MKDLPTPFEVGQRRTLARDLEKMRVGIARALDGDNITVGPGLFKSGYNGKIVISSRRSKGKARTSLSSPRRVDLQLPSEKAFPTASDLKTTIESAYSSDNPRQHEKILIEHESRIVFVYEVWDSLGFADTGRYAFTFTAGGRDWGVIGWSTGTFTPDLS